MDQMGWEAVKVTRYPMVLFLSLERSIILRGRVIISLNSEELVKKDL